MTHGREKIGLRLIGGLGFRGRGLKILGPVGDLMFQLFKMLDEAPVALANIRNHGVETVNEHADLVGPGGRHGHGVIVALLHATHGRRQAS